MTVETGSLLLQLPAAGSVPMIQWSGNIARVAGLVVGSVTKTTTGFRYKVILNTVEVAAGERRRRRDACRQVDRVWRRLLAQRVDQKGFDPAFVEHVRFLQQVDEEDHATAVTADRIIAALANRRGVSLRRIATGYTAWRLSHNGQARDFRWVVVQGMDVLDVLSSVEKAIGELRGR